MIRSHRADVSNFPRNASCRHCERRNVCAVTKLGTVVNTCVASLGYTKPLLSLLLTEIGNEVSRIAPRYASKSAQSCDVNFLLDSFEMILSFSLGEEISTTVCVNLRSCDFLKFSKGYDACAN